MACVIRYLKLANALKVMVVSDATTEKAAAALSVRVGESLFKNNTQIHLKYTIQSSIVVVLCI